MGWNAVGGLSYPAATAVRSVLEQPNGDLIVAGSFFLAMDYMSMEFDGFLNVYSAILLIGAVIANIIGTTGASMLLIRPFIRLGLDPGGNPVDHLLAESEELTHPSTPTLTSLNRAGAALCPVWPTCTGCPFPQLGVPQCTHSSPPASRSREFQKRGVIPV